jgi:hypothetical protein
MKRIILTDESGRILASAPAAEDLGSPGVHFGYRPLRGQHSHTVEIPSHVQTLEALQELHKTHRVEKAEGVSLLIRS